MTHLTEDLKIKKVSIVGFCWGYWLAVKMFSIPHLTAQVVSTCGPHPSVGLEDGFFGGSSAEMSAFVNVPTLLMPTSNDNDTYRVGGAIYTAIQSASGGTSVTSDYPLVVHGFLARGDETNATVQSEIKRAEGEITSWINKHFQ